jgi:fructose-1-phosphate kinase PfkB-like protein
LHHRNDKKTSASATTASTNDSDIAAPDSTSKVVALDTVVKLTGSEGGLTATAFKTLTDSLTPTNSSNQPTAGDSFVAVTLSITNTGSAISSLDLGDALTMKDIKNKTYSPSTYDVAQCTNIVNQSGSLASNATITGCAIFELPTGATPASFEFTPDGGYASDAAIWKL